MEVMIDDGPRTFLMTVSFAGLAAAEEEEQEQGEAKPALLKLTPKAAFESIEELILSLSSMAWTLTNHSGAVHAPCCALFFAS